MWDGVDNNCNGTTNEQNALNCTNYYYDGEDTFEDILEIFLKQFDDDILVNKIDSK